MDNQTLEKLKRIYDQADTFGKELIENEFPELKKSEDEKNIKDLIDELKVSLRAANCQNDATGGGHEKRIALLEWGIAWLEKQTQCGEDDSKMKELFENLVLSLCNNSSALEILQIYGKSKEDCLAWLEKQGKENTELPNGEDYGIDSLYHALRILQASLGDVDGYQSDDGILEHECAISAVEKLYTQIKWTEEDEHSMKQIIACLRGQINSDLPTMTNWIKSIKQRLTIQTEEESK